MNEVYPWTRCFRCNADISMILPDISGLCPRCLHYEYWAQSHVDAIFTVPIPRASAPSREPLWGRIGGLIAVLLVAKVVILTVAKLVGR